MRLFVFICLFIYLFMLPSVAGSELWLPFLWHHGTTKSCFTSPCCLLPGGVAHPQLREAEHWAVVLLFPLSDISFACLSLGVPRSLVLCFWKIHRYRERKGGADLFVCSSVFSVSTSLCLVSDSNCWCWCVCMCSRVRACVHECWVYRHTTTMLSNTFWDDFYLSVSCIWWEVSLIC